VIEDDFKLSSYDYVLPPELVAQTPLAARDASRLLVLDRQTGAVEHGRFAELPDRLRAGDLLVTNRSRVFPARLLGRRERGGKAEILLVRRPRRRHLGRDAAPRPAVARGDERRGRAGPACRHRARRPARASAGRRAARRRDGAAGRTARHGRSDRGAGARALRPCAAAALHRREDDLTDRDRYQTVYAREPGSVAAPTAGLHFTHEVLARLAERGVERTEIVLHVGPGTFRPVEVEDVRKHHVDPERVLIPEEAAAAIERARAEGRRVVAVGTTVTRTLESALDEDGRLLAGERETALVIVPGYRFRVVSALVTNFHLPGSSLLLLASAFAGRERLLAAYRSAVAERYRFYSYGDAMLIA
jgi:S-adenosylmethionine:tRNA ribosyltransferase-isomerase